MFGFKPSVPRRKKTGKHTKYEKLAEFRREKRLKSLDKKRVRRTSFDANSWDLSLPSVLQFSSDHFNRTPPSRKIHPVPAEPKQYSWVYDPKKDFHDACNTTTGGKGSSKKQEWITLKPYQTFVGKYFIPANPLKGLLLYYSIGSGKLCTGINDAYQFQKNGWNVLWVTRTTLLADIDKNLYDLTCHEGLIKAIKDGAIKNTEAEKRSYFSHHFPWIARLSFKMFSNICGGAGSAAVVEKLRRLNGKQDLFRKTLIVIDEAHKFLEPDQFSMAERPNFNAVEKAVQHSYDTSGDDSCKLLLMTGTPVGSRPEDTLLRLMNLLIPVNKITESDFQNPAVLAQKLKGMVLKLDISTDPTLFAQPTYEDVIVPLSSGAPPVSDKSKAFYDQCAPLTSHAKAKAVFPDMTMPKFKEYKEQCKAIKLRLNESADSQFGDILGCAKGITKTAAAKKTGAPKTTKTKKTSKSKKSAIRRRRRGTGGGGNSGSNRSKS